ncbi:MAG TPA: hypothetical protein VF765_03995 [Polyangiaceae bacterium]
MKRIALLALALVACGGGTPKPTTANSAPGGSKDPSHWPADDRSLCEGFVHWKENPQLDVSETVGPGSFKPNIRRIYKLIGDRDDRHQVLMCREIDTNLDGIKDVVRTFNDKGEPVHEEADTNYDGKIDDWVNFADGRIAEEDMDTTMSAGRPNVWKFYMDGELSRIRRNTHCPSGKPDVWEIYYKNRLERVGNDSTCDGHVDRWDRDTQLMAQEEAQTVVEVVDGGVAGPANNGLSPVTVGTSGQVTDGGAPEGGGKKKKK